MRRSMQVMFDLLPLLAAAVLALTFAWAAAAKALRFSAWRAALARYELPPLVERAARGGVPVVEAAVAGLIISGPAKVGAAVAVALLGAFSAVLFSAYLRHGSRVPCGCFGRATTRDYRVMLLRNGLLAVCAAAVLVGPGRIEEGAAPPVGPGDVVPAALVGLGVVAAVIVGWQVQEAARRGRRR